MMNAVLPEDAADASMARPSREDAAGEEEIAIQQEPQQHKSQSRRQLTAVREQMELKQAELAALMAQSEDLSVKVEGKPSVYDQIEAGRASQAKPKKAVVSPAAGTACWKKLQTTRHHTSGSLSPAVAFVSGTAAASTLEEVSEVFEYRGRSTSERTKRSRCPPHRKRGRGQII